MREPEAQGSGQPAAEELAAQRDYLFRFALTHLRDPARAEDVVQETLLAAMEGRSAMRELMGLETDEICKELGITANNCWVMLYRARMSLRQCLEARWFQHTP